MKLESQNIVRGQFRLRGACRRDGSVTLLETDGGSSRAPAGVQQCSRRPGAGTAASHQPGTGRVRQ